MKLTISMIRNVCLLFLTLKEQAEAEGLTQAAANADKAYRRYDDLLRQAKEKRSSGVGAGQPLLLKNLVTDSVPKIGGAGNGKAYQIARAHRAAE